jgi:hypothetical protein
MKNIDELLDWKPSALFALPSQDAEQLQLASARQRFDELIDRIPMLALLAEKQRITEIASLNDLVPILFKHTALKSYPLDILEQGRFDRLTAWLDKLTAHDLSSFDATKCETIDDWLLKIEQETPMRLAHSTGTSGKVSFFPRSTQDTPSLLRGFLKCFEGVGNEPKNEIYEEAGKGTVFVWLGFRQGNSIPRFLLDEFAKLTGSEDSVVALYPGAMSVDVMSLNGRMRAAEAAGRLYEFKVSPALLARREALLSLQADRPSQLRQFIKMFPEHYSDQKTIILGTSTIYLELKAAADELGIKQPFGPNALATGGGGTKGMILPDGYEQQINNFLGVDRLPQFYAMTEISGWMRSCPEDRYHIPPYTIPFVLDPDSGEPLPRTGQQTGRFAFFDLLAKSYWGGCVSGDEVTIDWDTRCPCGRGGPHIVGKIERYSDKNRGDDKITCSGAPKAHDDALNFLAGLASNSSTGA